MACMRCNGILFTHESPRPWQTFVPDARDPRAGLSQIWQALERKPVYGVNTRAADWGTPGLCAQQWMWLATRRGQEIRLTYRGVRDSRAPVSLRGRAQELGMSSVRRTAWKECGLVDSCFAVMQPAVAPAMVVCALIASISAPAEVERARRAKAKDNAGGEEPQITCEQYVARDCGDDLKVIARAADALLKEHGAGCCISRSRNGLGLWRRL